MTFISIRNVSIDMNMQTITGESNEEIVPIFAEFTDADMCVIRTINPSDFVEDLFDYVTIRLRTTPGVYSSQGMIPINGFHLNSFPEIYNWAYKLTYNILPEYLNPIVDKVSFYTSGGFKVRIKTYNQIY